MKMSQGAMSEAIDFIAVATAALFLLPFSAQKTRVKPQIHLNHLSSTTSAWRISYPQPAILVI
jgi:hypothetical protein